MKDNTELQLIYEQMSNAGLPTARFPYNLKEGDFILADVSRFQYPYRFGNRERVKIMSRWENGLILVEDSDGMKFKIRPEEVLRREIE